MIKGDDHLAIMAKRKIFIRKDQHVLEVYDSSLLVVMAIVDNLVHIHKC